MPANEINLTNTNSPKPPSSKEQEEYLVRMVSILDRAVDQFHIPKAVEGMHYEWHPDDPQTHHRLTQKGFVVDDEAGKSSQFSHTDGTGSPRIGDVRCYSIPLWKKQILDKVERERAARAEDPRRSSNEFIEAVRSEPGIVPTDESNSARRVTGPEIQTILNQR